ncbi:MAG: undecaprenyl-diphosphate phosphatase [Verrucomicrobia bacterium]|nr:undecaprenyl-diphosphate phosphatase [Verrucomicrobiota bacterium]
MSLFEALILGLVQGIAEFLPISSSAHLKFTKWLLGIADGQHLEYFDLVCHGGTLLALILFLWKDILKVLSSFRLMSLYALAIVPLIPAYLFLKPLRVAAAQGEYLGYCLVATAALLFLASRKKEAEVTDLKWKDVVCIGVMQTMALIPGISRSGSTISAARFCGWNWMDAARFSFLLAVPTVLGGELLETVKLLKGTSDAVGALRWECYAGGFISSFAFGLLGVRWMFKIYEKGNVRPFAWYCLGIGLLAWMVFHAW